jgi:phenylacetic acid degradation operon negative regulatory protein
MDRAEEGVAVDRAMRNIVAVIAAIVSSVADAPTSDFVYSSLSFYGRRRGGELPGTWFVEALGALGIDERRVRQTLYRMEHAGALLSRRAGRVKWYRASPTTAAILDAGVARVALPADEAWDGQWTLVHYRVGEAARDKRDRIRDVLLVEGFGSLGPGLYAHPRDRTARLLAAAAELGLRDRLQVFRGTHVAGTDDRRLVAETWDLGALARRYRAVLARFRIVADEPSARWAPMEAFALRFAFMFEFFRISWEDPSLPESLLPADWPGEEARAVADRLMHGLLPGAIAFGDLVLVRDQRQGGHVAPG